MDSDGSIQRFIEKPDNPQSDLASAAIFLASPDLLSLLPEKGDCDFSKIVLPQLEGKMLGYEFEGFNIDIGTPENYRNAETFASNWLKSA